MVPRAGLAIRVKEGSAFQFSGAVQELFAAAMQAAQAAGMSPEDMAAAAAAGGPAGGANAADREGERGAPTPWASADSFNKNAIVFIEGVGTCPRARPSRTTRCPPPLSGTPAAN